MKVYVQVRSNDVKGLKKSFSQFLIHQKSSGKCLQSAVEQNLLVKHPCNFLTQTSRVHFCKIVGVCLSEGQSAPPVTKTLALWCLKLENK